VLSDPAGVSNDHRLLRSPTVAFQVFDPVGLRMYHEALSLHLRYGLDIALSTLNSCRYLHEPKTRFPVGRLIPLAGAGIAPAESAGLTLAHRKLLHIEPELFRIGQEALPVELRRAFEQEVVHLPVLSLIPCVERRLCGKMGIIAINVGIVFDDEADLAPVYFPDLLDGRTGRHAVRSLEIQELDNGYRCISGTD